MIVIAVAGGSGSGKTYITQKIAERIGKRDCAVLCTDWYYKNRIDLPFEERKQLNFDHPTMLDDVLLHTHLNQLKSGSPINAPVYSYLTCSRSDETHLIDPAKYLIIEGLFAFCSEQVIPFYDISFYLFMSQEQRLKNILVRDAQSRARDNQEVIERFETMVNPMHNLFIEPSKKYADVIINTNNSLVNLLDTIINRCLVL